MPAKSDNQTVLIANSINLRHNRLGLRFQYRRCDAAAYRQHILWRAMPSESIRIPERLLRRPIAFLSPTLSVPYLWTMRTGLTLGGWGM
jgi:hypothetical protein